MERQIIGHSPIGEKFFLGKNVLQVVEGSCLDCFFNRGYSCQAVIEDYDPKCTSKERVDEESVAFKLVGTIAPDGRIIPLKELPNS